MLDKQRFEKDWIILEAAAGVLEQYLLSKELYWPISSPLQNPGSLTIGNLLFAQARLSSFAWSSSELTKLTQLVEQINSVRSQWRTNWEGKCKHEFSARLTLWRNSLMELLEDIKTHSADYPHEVRWRVLLEILKKEIEIPLGADMQILNKLDTRLQNLSHPGSFVWEEPLQISFGKEKFWFLYIVF